MNKLTETALLWLVAACAGCGTTCTRTGEEIECINDSNCDLEVGGECLTACSGSKWCVYPEVVAACPSGKRWSDLDTGDGLAGECLEGSDICANGGDAGPDGGGEADCQERIAFQTGTASGTGILSMNPDGSDIVDLTGVGTGVNLEWSPDGKQIAFVSTVANFSEIFVMNADGSGVRRLTNEGDNNFPHWAPDGSFIVFTCAGDLCRVSPTGTDLSSLTATPGLELGGIVSRNSTRIAYLLDGAMHSMDPNGGADRTGIAGNPSDWSPIADLLLFQSGDIFVVDDVDGSPTNLTNTAGLSSSATWSPDGSMIAFVEDDEIFVMTAQGNSITNITNNPDFDRNYSWSPDSTQIAFLTVRNGQPGIWVVNIDGSNPTQLVPVEFTLGTDVKWSPCQAQQ